MCGRFTLRTPLTGLSQQFLFDLDAASVPAAEMAAITPRYYIAPDYSRWLNPATTKDDLLSLLQPYPADAMKFEPVSRKVNSSRNSFASDDELKPDQL